MSKRNRRDYFGAVSAAVVVVVAVLFALTIWDTAVLQTENRLQSESYARDYAQKAERRIAEDCTMPQPALADCVEQIIAAGREQQRAERDLRAQRDMAQYAWAVVVVSGSGVFVTLIGIVYVARTLEATRDGNEINRRNGEAQVRAYLSVEDCQICAYVDPVMGERVYIRFFISNSGNSPARGVMVGTVEGFAENLIPQQFSDDKMGYSFPGDIRAGAAPVRGGHVLSEDITPNLFLDVGFFHVLIRLDYFDVFQEPQSEVFRLYWETGVVDIYIDDAAGEWFAMHHFPTTKARDHFARADRDRGSFTLRKK